MPLKVAATGHDSESDPAYELATGGRTLLQERLGTFALVTGAIAIAYWPAFYLIWAADPRFSRAAVLAHIFSRATVALLLVYTALFLICRARPWPRRWLPWIDVLAMAAIGLAYGPIMLNHPSPVMVILEGLLAITTVLFIRALLVPSSALRTALGGTLVCLGTGAGLLSNPAHFEADWIGFQTLGPLFINWSVVAVVLSSVASGVLYGLRRQVHDARRLGQYTLKEKLGEGGMGVVYRAQHAMLRRPTAIKLLSPSKQLGTLERFEREVQLMAALTHPNTVAVHDYGRTADGVFYYVMEHLEGVDLEELVGIGGPQPAGRVLHILRQICGSLDEAHGRGLIHRDIKPGNVFLCRGRSQPDTIKVLDFGLAKDTATASDPGLSADQSMLGTPLYISPEGLTGGDTVDARSDLYSLGALAYFLLTGTPVFTGRTTVEVCARHLHAEPEPPSARLGLPVPADLEALVLACLKKDRADRPAGAAVLADALDRCADAGSWTKAQADAWWTEHGARVDGHRRARVTAASSAASVFIEGPRKAWS
jgi:serine/threonine-protein kinase